MLSKLILCYFIHFFRSEGKTLNVECFAFLDPSMMDRKHRASNIELTFKNFQKEVTNIVKLYFDQQSAENNGTCTINDVPLSCSEFSIDKIKGS